MNHTTLQRISTLIQVGVRVKRFPLTYIPLSSFVIILCLTRTYSLVYVFFGIGPICHDIPCLKAVTAAQS